MGTAREGGFGARAIGIWRGRGVRGRAGRISGVMRRRARVREDRRGWAARMRLGVLPVWVRGGGGGGSWPDCQRRSTCSRRAKMRAKMAAIRASRDLDVILRPAPEGAVKHRLANSLASEGVGCSDIG